MVSPEVATAHALTSAATRSATGGYQQTEIGVLPNDWRVEPIENFATITTGGRNTQDRIEDGAYPFFVRSQTVERIDTYSFDGEAVLTAGDGVGTGKVFHYVNGKCDVHQRVYRISDFRSDVHGYFFYLFFAANFYDRIMQMTAKSSVDSVRREMIARMLVALPPPDEQVAIAQAISDANALIDSLDDLIAKRRATKRGAMEELLSGSRRLPGFKGEWHEARIGDVADVDTDSLSSNTDASYAFQYISLEDVEEGVLKSTTEQVFGSAPSRARRRLRKNDVLFGTVRPNLQSHCLISEDVKDHVCSTGFAVIRCRPDHAVPGFVFSALFGEQVRRQIDRLIAGSNYPSVNGRDVKELQILLPKPDEQAAIASALADMDDEIAAISTKLKKARQIKQGMMHELLTGRVRLV